MFRTFRQEKEHRLNMMERMKQLFWTPIQFWAEGGLFKGFNEIKFVPGAHAKFALRFDYGRYNELLSAIDVGINASNDFRKCQFFC